MARRQSAVETDDFRYHRGSIAFDADHARELELRRRGFTVRRFTGRQIDEQPGLVAADLRAAFHQAQEDRDTQRLGSGPHPQLNLGYFKPTIEVGMAEQVPSYDEFSIRIQPGEDDSYQVLASAPDGSTASGMFTLPFTEAELDNFVLRVGRQRVTVRGYRSAQMEEAKRFGTRLFEALMVDGVRDVFRAARGAAESHRKGLRVTMCLTDVPELMGVPWEYLYERPRFLAQSIYSPVVRSLDLAEVRMPHPVELPLNVLGMVSRPNGLATLDVEREKEKLALALVPLVERGLVTLDWLELGTLGQLDQAIGRASEVHVFHYVGHGAYDMRTDGGILVLEDSRGEPHEVTGEELGSLLQDERSLRLAVLNSCEGARSSHVDPFSGVASSLVQYGIPAVIGMQFEITDEAAIAFASRLYTSLAEGYPVDAALAQARRSIFAAGNDIEFGTPVLFLRGADAHLFDLTEPAPPELADSVATELDQPPLAEFSPEYEIAPANGVGSYSDPPLVDDWDPPLPPPPESFLSRFKPRFGWPIPKQRRVSNVQLAKWSVTAIVIGTVLVAIFGHDDPGFDGRDWADLIVTVGSIGLLWVVVRLIYDLVAYVRVRFFAG